MRRGRRERVPALVFAESSALVGVDPGGQRGLLRSNAVHLDAIDEARLQFDASRCHLSLSLSLSLSLGFYDSFLLSFSSRRQKLVHSAKLTWPNP